MKTLTLSKETKKLIISTLRDAFDNEGDFDECIKYVKAVKEIDKTEAEEWLEELEQNYPMAVANYLSDDSDGLHLREKDY